MKRLIGIAVSLVFTVVMCFVFQWSYITYGVEFLKKLPFNPAYTPWLAGVLFGLIFYLLLSSFISNAIIKLINQAEEKLVKMSGKELFVSVLGTILGLGIANLLGIAIRGFGTVGTVIVIFLNIIFGYLGFQVSQRKKDDFNFNWNLREIKKSSSGKSKILDTSVIIDGRILDLLQTGFIEGKIIIPNFVLEELRHIADSSDPLKRNRGRRGLDILNEIQKQQIVTVEISDFNTKEQLDVDSKLLKMAKKLDAYVVTNDFNLNKVAEFQGVLVLNINELANAIKPVVLPGEEMRITIVKEGRENGQGVAYLNDGTMIVAEGGNKFIGETVDVIVTSVLQTAAGRMIFAKIKDNQ